jgi:hypothetical protein
LALDSAEEVGAARLGRAAPEVQAAGRRIAHRGIFDQGKSYKNEEHYRSYTQKIASPPFNKPKYQQPQMGIGTPGFRSKQKLDGFLKTGIRTPQELGGKFTSSGDETKRTGNEISVNVLAPTKGAQRAAELAQYAAYQAANGAIPVVIEQHGDSPASGLQAQQRQQGLEQRALESALAVIRPDALKEQQQQAVQSSVLAGGGEATLRDGISSANFVQVLVPVEFSPFFSESQVAQHRIQFVGRKSETVSYNTPGHSVNVQIVVPEYCAALQAILTANPDSIFLTHVIRLGEPNPLGLHSNSSMSSGGYSNSSMSSGGYSNSSMSSGGYSNSSMSSGASSRVVSTSDWEPSISTTSNSSQGSISTSGASGQSPRGSDLRSGLGDSGEFEPRGEKARKKEEKTPRTGGTNELLAAKAGKSELTQKAIDHAVNVLGITTLERMSNLCRADFKAINMTGDQWDEVFDELDLGSIDDRHSSSIVSAGGATVEPPTAGSPSTNE